MELVAGAIALAATRRPIPRQNQASESVDDSRRIGEIKIGGSSGAGFLVASLANRAGVSLSRLLAMRRNDQSMLVNYREDYKSREQYLDLRRGVLGLIAARFRQICYRSKLYYTEIFEFYCALTCYGRQHRRSQAFSLQRVSL